jgi:hypothetical protein
VVNRSVVPAFAAALATFGCGTVRTATDGGLDGSLGDASSDAGADAWWAKFDARFDPDAPPLPGEYPPERYKCMDGNDCYGAGHCNGWTGWCCFGREELGTTVCKCGATLGCSYPEVCCVEPGDFLPHCVASIDTCRSDGGAQW